MYTVQGTTAINVCCSGDSSNYCALFRGIASWTVQSSGGLQLGLWTVQGDCTRTMDCSRGLQPWLWTTQGNCSFKEYGLFKRTAVRTANCSRGLQLGLCSVQGTAVRTVQCARGLQLGLCKGTKEYRVWARCISIDRYWRMQRVLYMKWY